MSDPHIPTISSYPGQHLPVANGGYPSASRTDDDPALSEADAHAHEALADFAHLLLTAPEEAARLLQHVIASSSEDNPARAFEYSSSVALSSTETVEDLHAPTGFPAEEYEAPHTASSTITAGGYIAPTEVYLPGYTQWDYNEQLSAENRPPYNLSASPPFPPPATHPYQTAQPWAFVNPTAPLHPVTPYPVIGSSPPLLSAFNHSPSASSHSPSSSFVSSPHSPHPFQYPASIASSASSALYSGRSWSLSAASDSLMYNAVHGQELQLRYRDAPSMTPSVSAPASSRPAKPRKVSSRLKQFPGDKISAPVLVNGTPKCPHCDITDGLSRHIKQHYAHLTEAQCTGRLMPRDAPYALAHPDRCVDAGDGYVRAGGCGRRFSRSDGLKRHLRNESLKIDGCLVP